MTAAVAALPSQHLSAPAAAPLAASPWPAQSLAPNPNRRRTIITPLGCFDRLPIRTPLLTEQSDLLDVIRNCAQPHARPGDVLFISEKAVAVTQGRAVREADMHIGLTARILWRFVAKVPYGTGLRRPSSMQCAVNECGAARIWLAAFVGALGKMVGRKGDFYRVAGMQAATIDAAGTSPMQPDCVIMGPRDPEGVTRMILEHTGIPAAIVDVNDIGGSWCLGASAGVDRKALEAALKDNPLGQGSECTPMGLLRVTDTGERS